MDRSSQKLCYFIMLIVFLLDLPFIAHADVVMKTPQSAEDYPESHFGSVPSQPDLGRHAYLFEKELNEDQQNLNNRTPADSSPKQAILKKEGPTIISKSKFGVQEIALIASDQGYFPKMVFVTRDIPVKMFITGASKRTLCIVIDAFQVKRQIRSQKIEEISFVPTSTGRYRFSCPVNGMEGEIFVKEMNTNSDLSRAVNTETIKVADSEE